MSTIIIIYSTTDGHTEEISQRLKRVLEEQGHRVTLRSIDEHTGVDFKAFDKIVLGASIRYGRHSKQVYEFIARNQQTLVNKPNAFFSVSLVARKPERNQPETNPYLKKFLSEISWQPEEIAIFAGKIDYPKYRTRDRLMIQLIMWMTKGPTNRNTVIDYTDWQKVESFGLRVSHM